MKPDQKLSNESSLQNKKNQISQFNHPDQSIQQVQPNQESQSLPQQSQIQPPSQHNIPPMPPPPYNYWQYPQNYQKFPNPQNASQPNPYNYYHSMPYKNPNMPSNMPPFMTPYPQMNQNNEGKDKIENYSAYYPNPAMFSDPKYR